MSISESKILNPKTGRMVSKGGSIGKRLILKMKKGGKAPIVPKGMHMTQKQYNVYPFSEEDGDIVRIGPEDVDTGISYYYWGGDSLYPSFPFENESVVPAAIVRKLEAKGINAYDYYKKTAFDDRIEGITTDTVYPYHIGEEAGIKYNNWRKTKSAK